MKILLWILICMISSVLYADVYVKGYYKKDGSYIAPHYRTNPDGNKNNNYSTPGNTNPHIKERSTTNQFQPPPKNDRN